MKSSISVLIYRKALVLARIRGGAGEIINIISTDVARIVEAVTNFHFLWSALVETILILALAFPTVGWAGALTAVCMVLLVLPLQIFLGGMTSNIQVEQTKITTDRVHLMSEILTAIKLIKYERKKKSKLFFSYQSSNCPFFVANYNSLLLSLGILKILRMAAALHSKSRRSPCQRTPPL